MAAGTRLDFHGDGTENDIDVVVIDRDLLPRAQAPIRLQLLQQLRQAWIQNLVQYRLVEGLQLQAEPQACAGVQDRFVVGHHGCRRMRI